MGRVAAAEDGLLRKTQTEERKGSHERELNQLLEELVLLGVAVWLQGDNGWKREGTEGCNLKTPKRFSGLVTMFFTYIFILHAFLLSLLLMLIWYLLLGSEYVHILLMGLCWSLVCPVLISAWDVLYLCFTFYLVLIWFHPPSYELIDRYMKWGLYGFLLLLHFVLCFSFPSSPVSGIWSWSASLLLFPSMGAKSYRGYIFSGE